jgi:pimeloyl-ACP methyl ester carboxylesterase
MSRWRRAVLSGGAALGAAATFNALVRRRVTPLDNPLGGEEAWFRWRSHRIAYTSRGAGPAVLLVHGPGVASWTHQWRFNVDALARDHAVFAIDLLGFGRSERPPVRYSARLYLALIADFAAQVVGAPVALVASHLSAAYAIILGARDPGSFPVLVLVTPTGLVRLHKAASTAGDLARYAVDSPVLGTAVFNTLVSRRALRAHLARSYANVDLVTDELIDAAYDTSHQPGAKYASSAFLSGHLNIDVRRALRRLSQPALLVWGEQSTDPPVEDVRGFRALRPDLDVAILDPAGSLPHDERPDEFNEAVVRFLSRVRAPIA